MSKAVSTLVSTAWLLCSCAAYREISVVEEKPAECRLLGEVAVVQGHDWPQGQSVEELKRKAGKLKANTLQCCWESAEAHFVGERDNGQPASVDGVVLSALAYSCASVRTQSSTVGETKHGASP